MIIKKKFCIINTLFLILFICIFLFILVILPCFKILETLRQLETISNSYLEVLAEGGIQLSLQSDLEADKIVKSVMIRASDGKYRERALSQLSGGQWRRVSMALDFAFAEIIRRKGTLRCNLIVMDEILTHLDASGRG